jgi:hypothetical protein
MARPGLEPGTPRFSVTGYRPVEGPGLQGVCLARQRRDAGSFVRFPAGLGHERGPRGLNGRGQGLSDGLLGTPRSLPASLRLAGLTKMRDEQRFQTAAGVRPFALAAVDSPDSLRARHSWRTSPSTNRGRARRLDVCALDRRHAAGSACPRVRPWSTATRRWGLISAVMQRRRCVRLAAGIGPCPASPSGASPSRPQRRLDRARG